jgi:Fic family protein
MANLEKKLAFDFSANQRALKFISEIDRFHGRWELTQKLEGRELQELRSVATIQSVGSSTRIEGSRLSDKEVERLLHKVRITKFESRDQQEVQGYYDALELVLENHADFPMRESTVLQLHGLLLRHSRKDERHRGSYKGLPNSVNATYPDGSKRTIFQTTPPHLVRKEMEVLLEWTNRKMEEREIHPLLITSLFVYEFLSIHPFQDGNGRLSRLLTTLLLLKAGYGFIQYISFEHQIEARKAIYYRALMNCQGKRKPGRMEDISEWVLFFLGSLKELAAKLERKYRDHSRTDGYLNGRQRSIVELLQPGTPMKLSDLRAAMPEVNVNTLKKDLQRLVAEGRIRLSGTRKAAVYRKTTGSDED